MQILHDHQRDEFRALALTNHSVPQVKKTSHAKDMHEQVQRSADLSWD